MRVIFCLTESRFSGKTPGKLSLYEEVQWRKLPQPFPGEAGFPLSHRNMKVLKIDQAMAHFKEL